MLPFIAPVAKFFLGNAFKSFITNKWVLTGLAVGIAYFAGYQSAKEKFTNYAVVAALEAENQRLELEYEVLERAARDSAAQLAARTSLQLQQDKIIEDYKETLDDSNSCQPTEEFLTTLESLTGTRPNE